MPTNTHHKDRGTCWSITINNPVATDEESINLSRQRGWTVDGQLEKGENGTPHYQLIVKTPQVRFSAVKKAFPRAHIELARNVQALEQYVHKEETKEGELSTESDQYPSLQRLWDLFAEYLEGTKKDWWNYSPEKALTTFDEFIRYLISDKLMVVETIAVNPQIRSCVKNFFVSIIERSNQRRQTDRQTDEKNVAVNEHNNAPSEERSQEATLQEA